MIAVSIVFGLLGLVVWRELRSWMLLKASEFGDGQDQRGSEDVSVITLKELENGAAFGDGSQGGSQGGKRLLLSIVNHVFDVTKGGNFYGRDGHYAGFTGRDATRAFATGNFDDGLTEDTSGLSSGECKSILEWLGFYKNSAKYPFVGYLDGGLYVNVIKEDDTNVRYEESDQYHKLKECAVGDVLVEVEESPCHSHYDFKRKRGSFSCKSPQVPRRALLLQSSRDVEMTEKCICLPQSRVLSRNDLHMYSDCDPAASVCNFEGSLAGGGEEKEEKEEL